MKYAIPVVALLLLPLPAVGQVLYDPEMIVQKDHPHFEVLSEHQTQIRESYDKDKFLVPTFRQWVRVESAPATQLFPKLSFYSISWTLRLHPDVKGKYLGIPSGAAKTVSIDTDTGKIEGEFHFHSNVETFVNLLLKHKVVLRSPADAERVWQAFCHIHHRHWEEHPFKRISDTKWHLGIDTYDQTVSTTHKTKTVVTRKHYTEVIVDRGSKRILSWEHRMDTFDERTLPKQDQEEEHRQKPDAGDG